VTPRVILFDALGTLIELAPPAPRLQAELARRYAVAIDEVEASRAMAAEIAYYRRHLDEGRDAASLALLRERCAAELRAALPAATESVLPAPRELVAALLASLHFQPYADVVPALTRYRARGMRLVVVSNWDVSLHAVLENVGLATRLDGIVTAAEVGVRKPAAAVFERALRLVGARPAEAIHVGDSLDEDVAGARAAGIEPVLISRGGERAEGIRAEGVRTVRTLAEPLF
jgi:putative hydrolase of the HAD superfamily